MFKDFFKWLVGDPLTPYRDLATLLVTGLGCPHEWEGDEAIMCRFEVPAGNRTYSCRLIIASDKFFMLFVDSHTKAANFPANIHAELSRRNQTLRSGKWNLARGYLHLTGEVKLGAQAPQAFTQALYEMLGEAVDFDDAHSAAGSSPVQTPVAYDIPKNPPAQPSVLFRPSNR